MSRAWLTVGPSSLRPSFTVFSGGVAKSSARNENDPSGRRALPMPAASASLAPGLDRQSLRT